MRLCITVINEFVVIFKSNFGGILVLVSNNSLKCQYNFKILMVR